MTWVALPLCLWRNFMDSRVLAESARCRAGGVRLSSMANGSRRVLEEVGDLIDVLAHGFRCGAGVALPQCRDDGFMPQDGSAWTALLLQRELARFHEQIVQCGHDTDDHAIARGAREDVVKSRILDDGRSAGSELLALRVEDGLQVGKVL